MDPFLFFFNYESFYLSVLEKLKIFLFEQDSTQPLFHSLGYRQHVLEPVLTDEIVRLEKSTQFQLFIGVASDMYDIALSEVDTNAASGGRHCQYPSLSFIVDHLNDCRQGKGFDITI